MARTGVKFSRAKSYILGRVKPRASVTANGARAKVSARPQTKPKKTPPKARAPIPSKMVLAKPRHPHDHVFNPAIPALVRPILTEGPVLPVRGKVRFSVSFNQAERDSLTRKMVIAANVGSSSTIALSLAWTQAGVVSAINIHSIPTLNSSSTTTIGAVSGRAMKASLSVTNTTAYAGRGSTVIYANLDQRLALPASPATMTAFQWNDVFNDLLAYPSSVTCNGGIFATPHTMVSHMVDSTSFHDFVSWKGAYSSASQFMDHLAEWGANDTASRIRPMSTMVMMFDTPSVDQTYFVTVDANFYTRWPVDTLQGQSMKTIQPISAVDFNKHAGAAQSSSSTALPAVDASTSGGGIG